MAERVETPVEAPAQIAVTEMPVRVEEGPPEFRASLWERLVTLALMIWDEITGKKDRYIF